jgi:hypothetical protein
VKSENLLRAIGALDENLIARAEKHGEDVPGIKTHKHAFSQKPRRLIACIAAIVIVCGIGVCAATGAFDGFFKHFAGDIDTYWDEILSTITSASYDDL